MLIRTMEEGETGELGGIVFLLTWEKEAPVSPEIKRERRQRETREGEE